MASAAADGLGRRLTGLRGGNRAVVPPSDGRNLQVLLGQVSNYVDYDQTVVSAGGLLSNYEHVSYISSTTRQFSIAFTRLNTTSSPTVSRTVVILMFSSTFHNKCVPDFLITLFWLSYPTILFK